MLTREDYINMLTILERPETLSKGATEAMATAVLYQNIKTHVQELDAEAAEKGRLNILKVDEERRASETDKGD